MSWCPVQCSTRRVEDKRDVKIQKSMTSQIDACWSGAFPRMVEEDEDESPHVDADETDEEAQDTSPALDDNCKGTSICFLTSPILSHSPPVHMYSPSSPLYYSQGL
jgi:hypothetical protein